MSHQNLVPFREMKDVSGEFSFEEYEIALTHPNSIFLGLFAMIHLNTVHPQYTNVKINSDHDTVSIYTAEGWQKCTIGDIFEQLKRENLECLQYVRKNGHDMLKHFYNNK